MTLPLEITLPSASCVVIDAELLLKSDEQWVLALRLNLRGEQVRETLVGKLIDIIHQLVYRIGFSAADANHLVAYAKQKTSYLN